MIFVRLFIDKIPDTWEPSTVWYLAAAETAIETIVLGILFRSVRIWLGI